MVTFRSYRIGLILAGLLLSVFAYTQPILPGVIASSYAVEASEYTTQFQAVLDEWVDPPGADTLAKFDAFTDSMVTNGYWNRADLMYWLGGNSQANSLQNWLDPSAGTFDILVQNSCTWTKWEGFTGNATNMYLRTSFNMTSSVTNFALDDGTVLIYTRIDQQEDRGVYGARESGDETVNLIPRSASGYCQGNINGGSWNIITTESDGLYSPSRTASNLVTVYQNGASLGTDTDASVGLPNAEMYILNRSAAASYSSNQVLFFMIMDGISLADHIKINGFVETLADYLGSGVQP